MRNFLVDNSNQFSRLLLHPMSVAAFIAAAIIYFLPPAFNRYNITEMQAGFTQNIHTQLIDLDHDGYVEKVILGYNYNATRLYMEVNKQFAMANVHVIRDVNKPPVRNLQLNWDMTWLESVPMMFGDYDDDTYEEVYVFCHRNDSLFLVGLDPLGSKGVFLTEFITMISFKFGSQEFDVFPGGLYDLNLDGYKEAVFTYVSGFSLSPRAIFSFDIRNDSLYSTNTEYIQFQGSPIIMFEKGEACIASGTYAPGNHADTTGGVNPDTTSMFCVFNKDLRPVFQPRFFGPEGAGIALTPVIHDGANMLAVSWPYPDNTSIHLCLYDLKGNSLSDTLETGTGTIWYVSEKYEREEIIVYDPFLGSLEVFDHNLQRKLQRQGMPKRPDDVYTADLDCDGRPEFLFRDRLRNTMTIYDNRLKSKVVMDFPREASFLVISSGIIGENGAVALFATHEVDYYYQYRKNPLFYYKYPFYILIYLGVAGIVALIFYYRDRLIARQFNMKQRLTQLELLTLRNQIEPHFTFNVLNTIGSVLMQGNIEKAQKHLLGFSNLLRNALMNADKIAIPLKEELAFTEEYLKLQVMRYDGTFDYKIIIGKEVDRATQVPRMCIQTFVENAVKHGLAARQGGGLISVSLIKRESGLTINIEDNGNGRKAADNANTTGKGLSIINELFGLYHKITGELVTYEIEDLYDDKGVAAGTRVIVRI